MMLRIECDCGHVGIVDASTLPRLLTCASCGAARRIDSSDGKAITSTARFEEWLAGERERPRVQPSP
jgi:hypothetical protein